MKEWIVVPEGLNKVCDSPSFIYKRVLDHLITLVEPEDCIYLAPANDFGSGLSEQQAAQAYLASHHIPAQCFSVPQTVYINTRGNAQLLKKWLISLNRWPLLRAHLLVYQIHAPRARMIFEQEGFPLQSLVEVPKLPHSSPFPIVPRLWYYQYPWVHSAYERLAFYLFRWKAF
jgi:uncharacterized SAM-binding protein YcdF (DUF218 family)